MSRLAKVNSLIRLELSRIMRREVDLPPEVLITVTEVQTSGDVRHAQVFLSILPKSKEKTVFKNIQNQIYHLQQGLNKRLKMKFAPKIAFVLDQRESQAARFEELLAKKNDS